MLTINIKYRHKLFQLLSFFTTDAFFWWGEGLSRLVCTSTIYREKRKKKKKFDKWEDWIIIRNQRRKKKKSIVKITASHVVKLTIPSTTKADERRRKVWWKYRGCVWTILIFLIFRNNTTRTFFFDRYFCNREILYLLCYKIK